MDYNHALKEEDRFADISPLDHLESDHHDEGIVAVHELEMKTKIVGLKTKHEFKMEEISCRNIDITRRSQPSEPSADLLPLSIRLMENTRLVTEKLQNNSKDQYGFRTRLVAQVVQHWMAYENLGKTWALRQFRSQIKVNYWSTDSSRPVNKYIIGQRISMSNQENELSLPVRPVSQILIYEMDTESCHFIWTFKNVSQSYFRKEFSFQLKCYMAWPVQWGMLKRQSVQLQPKLAKVIFCCGCMTFFGFVIQLRV